MQGWMTNCDTKLRTWVRVVSRLGAYCGVAFALALTAGCPPPITAPAPGTDGGACDGENSDECSSSTFCTPLVCNADGICEAGTAPCPEGETCNDEESRCENCTADTVADDCADDGNVCTTEICNDVNRCDTEDVEGCCNTDEDCDDGDNCTADVCGEDNTCSNDPVDCPDQICNPADGACVDCLEDADCAEGEVCEENACVSAGCTSDEDCPDDGLFCSGAESCDLETGECVSAGDPCLDTPDTPVCDEDGEACVECLEDADCDDAAGEVCQDNACVVLCETDADCDDGDLCTDDTCNTETGACEFVSNCEDDGVFCNGTESCDPEVGDCVSSGDPCADNAELPVCDEDAGECTEGTACASNDDCPDDGLFCNGTESCNTDTGFCESSGDPCADGETCNEDLNACEEMMGETIDFTLGTDNLSGTGGADTFSAPLLFNQPTGTSVPSLQTGDSANGGDGNDVLNAQFNFAAVTTVAPTLTSIETINITDFGTAATTIAGTNLTGVTDINVSNSTNANVFTINNLPAIANLGVSQQAIGVTLSLQAAATSGASDAATMTFNGMTAGTVTYTSGNTNGLELLNIAANGAASTVADIVMNGTTLTTINASGSADFTHTATVDANVTTLNASTATGATNFTQTNAGVFTYTGGSGDDTMILGATYGTTDILDGGAGTDILGGTTAVIGGTTSNQTNVTNFETLRVSDAHTTALNVSHFGSIGEVVLDLGSNGGSITNATSGFNLTCGTRAGAAVGGGTLTTSLSGSATTDVVTYTLNDCEQVGAVTFTGAETLNLVSNLDLDGSAANSGTANQNTLQAALVMTDTAAAETLVVTGTEQMNVTGAITANVIDASGMTEPFVMGAANAIAGTTVTGGAGADTLFGSAGNDIINGGTGNDILNPMAGSDIVSGGSGADTFRQSAAAANGVDRQTISDFDDTVTTGDVFNFNSGVATLTGTNNFASSAAIQTHSTAGNLAVNAAAEVVVVTSGTTANLLTSGAANVLNGTDLLTAVGGTITGAIAGQNDILICVADTNGDVGVYHASSADNAIVAGEITLVAILQGADVTLANLVFNNFSNGA